MAITEVGNHQTLGYGTAVSDTHGLSIAANDVVVCLIWILGTPSCTDNNGDYALTGGIVDADSIGTACHYNIYYRVAGASEPSAYAFTLSGSNINWGIQTRVFRGVDTSDPWNVLTGNGYASAYANTTTRAAASITTDRDGCLAIAYYTTNKNTFSWDSVDNGFGSGLVRSTAYPSMASYTKTIASAGAVGTTTATYSPEQTQWAGGGIVALQPPADGTFLPHVMTHHFIPPLLGGR